MSKPRIALPARVKDALNETGLDWAVEHGAKHQKIRLSGHMIAVIGRVGGKEWCPRAMANAIACIRRKSKEIKDGLHK